MTSIGDQSRVTHAQELSAKGSAGISELISMLTDSSWLVRRVVVQSLASMGELALAPVCEILLTKRDDEARIAAAVDTMVLMSGDVDDAVISLAQNNNPAIVADAAQILGRRRQHSSVPILVLLSKHSDDNVAAIAIEALGRIGGRASVEAMLEAMKSENFFRVFPAIDVLGRSGDPRAIGPLVKILENPSYLHEAIRALGKTGERSAVRPLLQLLKSTSDANVRTASLALLDLSEKFGEKSGGDTSSIEELIKSQSQMEIVRRLVQVLSNSDIAESIAICYLLGAIGSGEAAHVLTVALDATPVVAKAAAAALKKIDKDIDQPLLIALREGSSERRKVLLPILMRFAAADEVAECLTDEDPEVRALACEALGRLGNASVVEKIFPLLGDESMRVVLAATAAIQSLGTRQARELAVIAAGSEKTLVRRAALRILAYLGHDDALQPMLAGLKDSDAKVREAALQGLPYLESSYALDALLESAKDPNAKTRALAFRSLGLVPNVSERIISLLLKGLSDSDSWVRYYACQALGRLEYDSATSEIVKLLSDEAGQVRVAAVEALSHLKSPQAREELRKAATSSELEIQRAALVGLGFAHRTDDLPVILDGVKSKDTSTKLMALSSLASFSSLLAGEAMSTAALDADERVSSAAINFLAARPEQNATRFLIQLLNSDATRDRAKIALQIPSKGRLATLLESLETANDEMATLIISILSRMEKFEGRAGLLSAIKSNNSAARKAAAVALAARREPEMISALQEAANTDEDPEVRQICKLLLHD